MGYLSFLGKIRKGSSGQLIITIPRKFRELVTINKLVYITLSENKEDISKGEQIKMG